MLDVRQVSKTAVSGLPTNRPERCRRMSVFVMSCGCMLGRRRSIIARDFQSRLAKTVDQVLDEFGIPPLPEIVARNDGEVRSYR
jgi:predicted SpoU family rRNA methylase